jgi:hypothetical protein
VADFRGVPHVYRSLDLHTDAWDRDGERFEPIPISPEVIALALEVWAMWELAA